VGMGMTVGVGMLMLVGMGHTIVGVLMGMGMGMLMVVLANMVVMDMHNGFLLAGIMIHGAHPDDQGRLMLSSLYSMTEFLSKHLFSRHNPREGLRRTVFWSIMAKNQQKLRQMLMSYSLNHDHSHDPTQPHDHSHAFQHAHGLAHSHGHVHENQKAVVNRLSRAIGHLEKVKRMVEEGCDCSEVLIQLAAVRSALDNTGKVILKDHMRHCMVDAVTAGDQDAIDDLCQAIDKFMK